MDLTRQTLGSKQIDGAVANSDNTGMLPLLEEFVDALPGHTQHLGQTFL